MHLLLPSIEHIQGKHLRLCGGKEGGKIVGIAGKKGREWGIVGKKGREWWIVGKKGREWGIVGKKVVDSGEEKGRGKANQLVAIEASITLAGI